VDVARIEGFPVLPFSTIGGGKARQRRSGNAKSYVVEGRHLARWTASATAPLLRVATGSSLLQEHQESATVHNEDAANRFIPADENTTIR